MKIETTYQTCDWNPKVNYEKANQDDFIRILNQLSTESQNSDNQVKHADKCQSIQPEDECQLPTNQVMLMQNIVKLDLEETKTSDDVVDALSTIQQKDESKKANLLHHAFMYGTHNETAKMLQSQTEIDEANASVSSVKVKLENTTLLQNVKSSYSLPDSDNLIKHMSLHFSSNEKYRLLETDAELSDNTQTKLVNDNAITLKLKHTVISKSENMSTDLLATEKIQSLQPQSSTQKPTTTKVRPIEVISTLSLHHANMLTPQSTTLQCAADNVISAVEGNIDIQSEIMILSESNSEVAPHHFDRMKAKSFVVNLPQLETEKRENDSQSRIELSVTLPPHVSKMVDNHSIKQPTLIEFVDENVMLQASIDKMIENRESKMILKLMPEGIGEIVLELSQSQKEVKVYLNLVDKHVEETMLRQADQLKESIIGFNVSMHTAFQNNTQNQNRLFMLEHNSVNDEKLDEVPIEVKPQLQSHHIINRYA